ncbi:MAG: DUF2149 domain-containing protein [Coriobacteriia bacterium]|nr:DUF2149 domain-containing protein [Coriobacteriia bacterium]
MPRHDFRSRSFLSSASVELESADPRASLMNLVDVMIVFSCGLIVALLTFWNLDMPSATEIIAKDDVTEIEKMDEMAEQMMSAGGAYSELGSVYQDLETGKLYMLTEDAEISDETTGVAAGSSDATGTDVGVPAADSLQ